MNFNKIDIKTWQRQKSYSHFLHDVPCTYSMTVNLDITTLLQRTKATNSNFFPHILYAISFVVNNHKEFRMDINENSEVGYYDVCNPCFTVFHEKTETFTNVWTEYSPVLSEFLENYNKDLAKYQNDPLSSKPVGGKNIFNVSCIPWTSFTGFNLNLQKGYDYFLPIFTIGKYFMQGDRVLLPFAVQVHHAVCDGFHVGRFLGELEEIVGSIFKINH